MKIHQMAPLLAGVLLMACSAIAENTPTDTCGYDNCPKIDPKKINVHLLPFTVNRIGHSTHLDSDYTLYAKNQINSVIESLNKNSTRRFAFSDTMFLWKWWQSENETNRKALGKLINEGRFEISQGGWTPNDEAVTHYQSLIDDFTWSFRRLNDTFGACARPKVGWQLGYGHSREQAWLLIQMGFDGTFISHVDMMELYSRYTTKSSEFIWDSSPSPSRPSNLFTTILDGLEPPKQYCYDVICPGRVPVVDDPQDANYNVRQKTTILAQLFKSLAKKHRTNNIHFPVGGPHTFQVAELWYSNFDKIVKYMNEQYDLEFNVFYSTPSCYLKSLNEQNVKWPVRNSDFLPFGLHNHHIYYTGYYTSKPTFKFFERQSNNFLQIMKQLSVLSEQPDHVELQNYREIMAAMQNIHAITGSHVVDVGWDYIKKLHDSMNAGMHTVSKALTKLMRKNETTQPPEFHTCLSLNISACTYSSDYKRFVVTVYNPTSQPLTTFIRLPVQTGIYKVQDYTGKEIITQLVPIPDPVMKIPGRLSNATMELVFKADNISALGFESFYIQQKSDEPQNNPLKSDLTIGGDAYKITVNAHGRVLVNSVKDLNDFELQQSFHYYCSAKSDYSALHKVSSGMIIFKPNHYYPKEILRHGNFHVHKGPLVEEIHQVINEWVSQVIRIYNDTDQIEFDWLIGPIPIENRMSKEIVTRYSSNLKNNHIFYTDSNGRSMIKRYKRSTRAYRMQTGESVAGNYYPVTTKISIDDRQKNARMSVLVDRAEGGSNLVDGEIELMLHRRIVTSDDMGGGMQTAEGAHGTGVVVRGQHYLLINNMTDLDDSTLKEKELAINFNLRPWLFFTPVSQSFEEWQEHFKMKSADVIKSLPKSVRILTLEPWKNGEILLRLEHIFIEKRTRAYSVPVEVNLKELFNDFTVLSVQEVTLGANQWLKDVHRLKWESDSYPISTNQSINTDHNDHQTSTEYPQTVTTKPYEHAHIVTLEPMEIRTFILKIAHGVKSATPTAA